MPGSVRIANVNGISTVVDVKTVGGSPSGIAAFSDAALTSSVALPATITADTTFYLPVTGGVTLSVKVGGTEIGPGEVFLTTSGPVTFSLDTDAHNTDIDRLLTLAAPSGGSIAVLIGASTGGLVGLGADLHLQMAGDVVSLGGATGSFARCGLRSNGAMLLAGLDNNVAAGSLIKSGDGGRSWALVGTYPGTDAAAVFWDGSRWIVGEAFNGDANTQPNPCVYTSPDGVTWTARANDLDGVCDAISAFTQLGSTLVAAVGYFIPGHTGPVVMTSDDAGATWATLATALDDGNLLAVASNGSLLVAAGADSAGLAKVMTSPDGATWTVRSTPADAVSGAFGGLAWDGAQWWLSGADTHVYQSADGVTWTDAGVAFSVPIYPLLWTGTVMLAGALTGGVGKSTTGASWELVVVPVPATQNVTALAMSA